MAEKQTDPLTICYHGTKKKNVNKILKEGFKPDTFFSTHLEDALHYGGQFVFEVAFKDKDLPDWWQVVCGNHVPSNRIICLTQHKTKKLYDNWWRGQNVFLSSLSDPEELPDYYFEES